MSARYAPSIANFFMAKWEEETIYNILQELPLYRRSIDDVIVLWTGDEESLNGFIQRLNNNMKNIQLSLEYNNRSIRFLALIVELQNFKFVTKTFFKQVDQNSYIPMESCHYDPWLINIRKGQLIRLRKND